MDILITEPCPIPNIDSNDVTWQEFLQAYIEYGKWIDAATKREVDRLKATGELPPNFDTFGANPIVVTQ